MDSTAISVDEFLKAAHGLIEISNRINDGWKLFKNSEDHKTYLKKETFITLDENKTVLIKAEYVIFYNLSYGVPSFSFNMWNSSGVLLSLEEIRKMCFIKMDEKEFYSVITQQEHPILSRPYFIMHPCQTELLLAAFKDKTKNLIVTFLSLITPLIKLNLPLEYGL